MIHRVAYWFTPIIALGVAFFLAMLLYRINQGDPDASVALRPTEISSEPSDKQESGWLERLSVSERLGYFFPVNEIYVDIDLNQQTVLEPIYQLKATIKDPYQLFCLKEELHQHQLHYFLQKSSTDTLLLINSKDQSRLNQLVKALRNYQIEATIVVFKEEQIWKNTKS